MQDREKIKTLFEKYLNKTITAEELTQLYASLRSEEHNDHLDALIQDYLNSGMIIPSELDEKSQRVKDRAWGKIQNRLRPEKDVALLRNYWRPVASIAATLLLIFSVSFYFINKSTSRKNTITVKNSDALPGSNKAVLISSNGSIYKLDGAKEEIITNKNSIRYKDGDILDMKDSIEKVTLSTPRGGQYRVTLSDGSKVWLNAASSLRYQTSFTGKERLVELNGEAYFEIAPDRMKPFVVISGAQRIKVLGTSFNLNSYNNEPKTVTTLISGSVQLSSSESRRPLELHPGEQAILDKEGFGISAVDASVYSAWKDGEFRFKATPLPEVLRQIERWYDLDIDYSNVPSDIKIHASIGRDKKLSAVLHALERISNLKFYVNERSVKIMQ